jgi:hypothetical protein
MAYLRLIASPGLPGLEYVHAEAGEILHIPCDHCETAFECRCGDHGVCNTQKTSRQLTFAVQLAPARGDSLRYPEECAPRTKRG